NSAALKRPELLNEIAGRFGNQCLVLAIDANLLDREWRVYVHGGRTPTPLLADRWAAEAEQRGAGEILLTSMRRDGTKAGFDEELTALVAQAVHLPIIASGGAGSMAHFAKVFDAGHADAGLAASIFHFGEIQISDLKSFLKTQHIPIR
ncbi:MAG: imidazole glycerol phosphate synthase subunit HisF, partial [Cryomorphaceae bacterium]